uniref:Uncharacterized protein n=1 Tax=Chromera velia CCMP2878 TaxID=1169474 RepID=A0A0G4GJ18_9ALVE|eukprot:Cvel_4775.t1-p1 / transcript=Cvel_4775.t1 / gene=Cvel_4775 / organism=Chromera_velia_CCMP2878 / gene_product=hypothetical protein / transcript_product=hypothetical protein / location=Cvel_scaffold213:45518-46207(+) / protein_length=230 / sequence_SO=supercontig / SO=protein_coding / is_pseudo=false
MGREYFGWNLWLDKDIHLDPDTDYATTLLPQPVEIRNPTVFRTFLAGLSATGNLVVLLGCFLGVFCVFALFACAAWDAIMIHCGKAERVTGGLYILREICYLLRTHWVKVLGFFMVYLFLITILEVLSTKGAYAYNDATGGGGTGTKEEKEVRAVQQGVLAMQTLLGDCYFVSWTVILPFRHGVLRVKAFLARGYTVKDLEGQQEEEPGSGTGGAAEGDSLIDPGPELPV